MYSSLFSGFLKSESGKRASAQPEPPPMFAGDEDEQAAAVRMQALHRGRKVRAGKQLQDYPPVARRSSWFFKSYQFLSWYLSFTIQIQFT